MKDDNFRNVRKRLALSNVAFLIKTLIKLGVLKKWPVVEMMKDKYEGFLIHNAPPNYQPTRRDCENLLLFHRNQMGSLFRYISQEVILNKRILEIGVGNSLGLTYLLIKQGAKEAIALDKERKINYWLDKFMRKRMNIDASKINFIKSSVERMPIPSESIDFCYSFAVLEHVRNPYHAVREIYRVLTKGAMTVHFIDLKDHRNPDNPLAFLAIRDTIWNLAQPHTNRLRSMHWRKLFEGVGFEIVNFAITDTVSDKYVNQIAERFSKQFKRFSVEELKIGGIAITARKV